MSIVESFTKTYNGKFRHATTVRHTGTVIAFAMDETRRIYYTVLDLANEKADPIDAKNWLPNPVELRFPSEIAAVGYAIAGSTAMPVVRAGGGGEVAAGTPIQEQEKDLFQSTTARLTADAPFQVLSDERHVYVLRQAIHGGHKDAPYKTKDGGVSTVVDRTLLLDRFVLVGTTLQPKLEVRFRRSRHKTRPQSNKDSLGARDMDGKLFLEPTQELSFIRHLEGGRFSVLLLPTQVAGVQRWQIFAHNAETQLIDSWNVERSADGLFNTRGTRLYTSPDPEHAKDVLERQPGTCPFTEKPLVPIASDRGYAEWALQFRGGDGYVKIAERDGLKIATGSDLTLEAWIKMPCHGTILSIGPLSLDQEEMLRFGPPSSNDDSGAFAAKAPPRSDDDWHHVAFVLRHQKGQNGDQEAVGQFYFDGEALTPPGTVPSLEQAGPIGIGCGFGDDGNPSDPVTGVIDEVRLWTRARGRQEIEDERHFRLVGDEPGLAGYWRFDEGSGKEVRDQTDHARHGELVGEVSWVASHAPVGDHPGMRRTSFGFAGRTIESAPCGLLYHQNESAPTGNGAGEAPLKRHARVMLTVATKADNPGSEEKNHIAALDLGVSREGRLAQIPDALDLEVIPATDEAAHRGRSLNQQLDRVRGWQKEIQKLEEEVTGLEKNLETLEPALVALHSLAKDDAAFDWPTLPAIDDLDGELRALITKLKEYQPHRIAQARERIDELTEGRARASVYIRHEDGDYRSLTLNDDGSGRYDFFRHWRNESGKSWHDKIVGVTITGPIELTVWQDSFAGRSYTFREPGNYYFDDWWRHAVNAINFNIKQSYYDDLNYWHGAQRQATEVRESLIQCRGQWLQKKSEWIEGLTIKKSELEKMRAELADLEATLGRGVRQPMSLVCTDRDGLTVSGAVLRFAWTKDRPLLDGANGLRLLDGANGKLALYFRGEDDQFFVAYYDTHTGRASFRLPASGGAEVMLVARAAGSHLDEVAITVTEDSGETCTLILDNTAEGAAKPRIKETWCRLPRDPEAFAAVLNGVAGQPTFLGVVDANATIEANRQRSDTGPIGAAAVTAGALAEAPSRFEAAAPEKVATSLVDLKNPLLEKVCKGATLFVADGTLTALAGDEQRLRRIEELRAGLPEELTRGAALILLDDEPVAAKKGQQRIRVLGAGLHVQPGRKLHLLDKASAKLVPLGEVANEGDGTLTLKGELPQDVPARAQIVVVAAEVRAAEDGQAGARRIEIEGELPDVRGDRTLILLDAENQGKARHLGPLVGKASGRLTYLVLKDAPKGSIPAGAALRLGHAGRPVKLEDGGHSQEGSKIHIEPMDFDDLEDGTPVHLVSYDYRSNVEVTSGELPTWCPEHGSLLVSATAVAAEGKVGSGGIKGRAGATPDCAWVADAPGLAIPFDGQLVLSQTDSGSLAGFDAEGDLTVEAWIKPASTRTAPEMPAAVVHHHSGPSHYALRLVDHGTIRGTNVGKAEGPGELSKFRLVAEVGESARRTKESIDAGRWSHAAAVYQQSYGLEFDGKKAWLDCGNDVTLDISRDLTLEVYLTVENLGIAQGLLTRGQLNGGPSGQHTPYALYLDAGGGIGFAFADKDGKSYGYRSTSAKVQADQFCKIAVTRKYQTETKKYDDKDKEASGEKFSTVKTSQWYDINIFVSPGTSPDYYKHAGPEPGNSSESLEIGRAYGTLARNGVEGVQESHFEGVISEVRIWNVALPSNEVGARIHGQEKGLVAWWRLEENDGNVACDSKGESHATIKGAKWTKNPDPEASTLEIYLDGERVETEPAEQLSDQSQGFFLGRGFQGVLEEVRVWKKARTQEQILDNLFTRLKGEKEDLIAYYTFDDQDHEGGRLADHALRGNHLPFGASTPKFDYSEAPISDDIWLVRSALAAFKTDFHGTIGSPASAEEYGDLQRDAKGNLTGALKRCYSFIDQEGAWHLITGYKVGNLKTEWVAQVQAAPQIIGYIEGAPPVPSENLTGSSMKLGEVEDYGGASAIELVEADDLTYIYASSEDKGRDTAVELSLALGFRSQTSAGFGMETTVEQQNLMFGHKSTVEATWSQLNEVSVGYGRNTGRVSRLELQGSWQDDDPAGYLNAAVGRRFIPANIGMAVVQSDTMDVFALRLAHNDAFVAYRMLPNPDIPKDWNLITFPINPRYTKQGTLDGKVGCTEDGAMQCDPDYPNAGSYGEWSYFRPKEAYALKRRIDRDRQELETHYAGYATTSAGEGVGAAARRSAVPRELAARNLANTYVWTADGGFYSESTEVMESVSESWTGAYSFSYMGGATWEWSRAFAKAAVDFAGDALGGMHVETTKTKGTERERSFSLEVELDGERDIQLYVNTDQERQTYKDRVNEGGGAYDENRQPVLRSGKVDAYRFMTFYLEPSTGNFEDFFGKVVDPIWLNQSSAPHAVALRQAQQADKKPECWRVMHRVTFVSRIVSAGGAAPTLQQKAKETYDIDSNYELIRRLEPFVRGSTGNAVDFAEAVRQALHTQLPELLRDHEKEVEKEVVALMSDYCGVERET